MTTDNSNEALHTFCFLGMWTDESTPNDDQHGSNNRSGNNTNNSLSLDDATATVTNKVRNSLQREADEKKLKEEEMFRPSNKHRTNYIGNTNNTSSNNNTKVDRMLEETKNIMDISDKHVRISLQYPNFEKT